MRNYSMTLIIKKKTELGLTIIEQIIYAMTDVNMIVKIFINESNLCLNPRAST